MISVCAFTETKVFPVRPQKLTITRRYEDSDYAFVASDLQFDCDDAADLYDAVIAGDDVTLVVYRDLTQKFLGTFQAEATSYDADKDTYSFTVLHIIKKIFDQAKNQMEWDGVKNILNPFMFDLVQMDYLPSPLGVQIRLDPNNFAFAQKSWDSNQSYAFGEFLKANQNYSFRDHWIDFAKHYRCIMYADDVFDAVSGLPVLNVVPRLSISKLTIGHDDLIADYKETENGPQYDAVIFPLKAGDQNYIYVARKGGAGMMTVLDQAIDNALDLRVPPDMYADGVFPFSSIPNFGDLSLLSSNPNWFMNSVGLGMYCNNNFGSLLKPYKEIEVLYREPVNVNPLESIAVKGGNIQINEIEDDLMNETTKVTGRLFE